MPSPQQLPRQSTGSQLRPARNDVGTRHPLAGEAARLIAAHRADAAQLTAEQDALSPLDTWRAACVLRIARLHGLAAHLQPYLLDGVDLFACAGCGAPGDSPCARGCRERLDDHEAD